MKKNGMTKKVEKHLRGDIKGYAKEVKHLKEEAKEDKDLIKAVRKKNKKR